MNEINRLVYESIYWFNKNFNNEYQIRLVCLYFHNVTTNNFQQEVTNPFSKDYSRVIAGGLKTETEKNKTTSNFAQHERACATVFGVVGKKTEKLEINAV